MTQNLKILVIDDDDLIRLTCCNILRKAGFEVAEARHGNEGIDLFKKEKPYIVITDMLMPEKEGLQTISEIRSIDPAARIIAMSGGGSTHNMAFLKLSQKLGAQLVLNKPFKPEDLMAAIRKLLPA